MAKKKDLAIFSKHLSVMLQSGINVVDALETLQNQTKSRPFKEVIKKCASDLKGGVSLSVAFAKYPKYFDQFYQNVVRVGEESGTLSKSLTYLEQKIEKEVLLKKRVDEALFYPKMILSLAVIIGFGISIFVLPQLGNMFSSFDVQLPLATRLLLSFADFMKHYGVYVFAGIVVLVIAIRLAILLKPVKKFWTRLMTSMPLLGGFIINKETSSFCRNLGIMLESGVPITKALAITGETTENALFAGYIQELNKALSDGDTLGETLQNGHFKKMPSMVTRMVTVGEKSGSLNQMLIYLADNFEEATDDQAKNLSALIEPILLVFIACMVLLIALAVILPIYQLTDVLK